MATNRPRIFFRADAGADIGYGHFMRSLALADMLKDDFEISFYTQTPDRYQIECAAQTVPLKALPGDDGKFERFLQALSGQETVVLDNYFFTTGYQQAIKDKGCRLVCIDDLHNRHYVADVVINHGLDNAALFDVEPYTRLCLGLEWALLRKPFLDEIETGAPQRDSLRNQKSVLVCMGGSDPENLSYKVLKALLEGRERYSVIRVVAGQQTDFKDLDLDRIEILRQLSAVQMRDLYLQSDVGILSASTVCMEALACGLPVVAGYYVDNQIGFYKYLCGNGYIRGLGNLLQDGPVQSLLPLPEAPAFDRSCMKGIAQRYRNLFLSL